MTIGIAVVGNSTRNVGAAMAGDLALGGHDVRLALEADQRDCLEAVRSAGGITLTPPASRAYLLQATVGADNLSSFGRSQRGAKPLAGWTSTL